MLSLEDGASAQETDTGDHALEYPAQFGVLHAALRGQQHKQRRPHRHQHVGAHSGGLAFVLALDAQQATEQRCQQQAQQDACELCRIGQVGKLCHHRAADLAPDVGGHQNFSQACR